MANYRRYTAEEIIDGMTGQWLYLFQDLAPELAEAMSAGTSHVPCPVHGGTDGFRLFKDAAERGGGVCNTCGTFGSGVKLLAWIRGYSTKDAFKDIARWYQGEQITPTIQNRPKPEFSAPKIDPAVAEQYIRRVWQESLDIEGTPAAKYLQKRGIFNENISKILRYHPGLKYYHGKGKDKKFYGTFPALIAPFRDKNGKIVCLHRIFVTPEGDKAPVPDCKKMSMTRGELVGSAIRLFQANDKVLGVAEGIETAEAAYAISKMPVWAAGTAGLLEKMWIPDSVELVVIWEDRDRSKRGQLAADLLEQRVIAMGKKCERYSPPIELDEKRDTADWLDVLVELGIEGFPAKWRRCKV